MAVGCEGKTGNVTISSRKHQNGQFQPPRTLYRLFFGIHERLTSIRSVDFAFTASKQTSTFIIIYVDYRCQPLEYICMYCSPYIAIHSTCMDCIKTVLHNYIFI